MTELTVPIPLLSGPPEQDYIVLGSNDEDSEVSPGLANVRGTGTPRNWDKRKGWGSDGAYLVYTGADLSRFSVDLYLWLDRHWTHWDDSFAPILAKPPAGTKVKALRILHPLINRPPWTILDVVVEDVLQPVQDDYGGWFIEIKFEAYRAPKPVLAKVGSPTPGAKNKVTARTALELATERLLNERADLAAKNARTL